ncbi:MAG: hypothetical protein VYE18_06075 [Pseudomonadota bacterium]|nr:hypothetical protein [Pseudomonadota bacterium]
MREVPSLFSGLLDRTRFDFYGIAKRSVPKNMGPEKPEAIGTMGGTMIGPEPASICRTLKPSASTIFSSKARCFFEGLPGTMHPLVTGLPILDPVL